MSRDQMAKMRIAGGQFQSLDQETSTFLKQLGITSIQFNTPLLPGDEVWSYEDLRALHSQCIQEGFILEAIENVPIQFYDKIMLGLPGRDQQIENYQTIIKHMGRIGIPILGHHFMPNFVWRTTMNAPGRGGAEVSAFDERLIATQENAVIYPAIGEAPDLTEERLWSYYQYFLDAVLPVAEQSGVRLALHPDDPPMKQVNGMPRLFYSPEQFKKAMAIANSDAWCLNLCLGCCSEMPHGTEVFEMIDFFGPIGKIGYVHFRDVQGVVPHFQECFLGEGNFKPAQVMRKLKEVGFRGFILDDHVPRIINDTSWRHRGRAHEMGYLKGVLEAVEDLDSMPSTRVHH